MSTMKVAERNQARRLRWQVVAIGGLLMALGGILTGATGLSARIPLPSWGLGAAALVGLVLLAGAGARLVTLRNVTRVEAVPEAVKGKSEREKVENPWTAMGQAFEGLRAGSIPILAVPDRANQIEVEAFQQGNEAFQFLARRQKVMKAAIDELREELSIYHRYLTKSQVGLIGANSVAERLEDLDKRLAKIRSVV